MIPFFNSIDELRKHVGTVSADFSIEVLESYAMSSLNDIAIITGKEVAESLYADFENNSLSAENEALVEKILKPIANMTVFRHSFEGMLLISDSGYTTEEGANTKRPYQWMLRDFRKGCLKSFSEGMNDLWLFVVKNIDDYPEIKASEEYLFLKKMPVNRLIQWQTNGRRIADWRTHYALTSEMSNVVVDMAEFISAELVTDIEDYMIDEATDEDMSILLTHVKRYLVHATINRALPNLPVSIEADGLMLNEYLATKDNNEQAKQISETNRIIKEAKIEMEKYKHRLVDFLVKNSSASKYVGFYNAYVKDVVPFVMNKPTDKLIKF